MTSQEHGSTEGASRRKPQQPSSRSLFDVPTPIKQLFDRFPLLTYPVNDLPQRAPRHRNAHVLHLFTTDEGAASGAPSYNPACLKWQVWLDAHQTLPRLSSHVLQAYLKFSQIEFRVASSSNHASPSGALPFVLPASPDPLKPVQPVPSGKLQRWTMNNSEAAIEESGDLRYEAYLSLLDHRIRRAWVSRQVLHREAVANSCQAVLHIPLPQLHFHRRTTLHPPYIQQPVCPPHNSA
jgi:metaxin